MDDSPTRFLLVYGSQTGQSQAIAEEIAERCAALNIFADIHCFGKIEKEFVLESERLVVIVVSSTGDGEPPDTVCKFWRRVKRKTLPKDHFSNMRYTLLGLGDSNYGSYCKCPHMIDDRLQELGATLFMKPGFADDAEGLEVVVEPWIEALLERLCSMFDLPLPDQGEQAVKPSSERVVEPSSERAIKPSSERVVEPFSEQVVEPSSERAVEPSSERVVEPSSERAVELSSERVVESSSGRAVEPSSERVVEPSREQVVESAKSTEFFSKDTSAADAFLAETAKSNLSLTTSDEKKEIHSLESQPSKKSLKEWVDCIPVMNEAMLTTPVTPGPYVHLNYISNTSLDNNEDMPIQNNAKLPFSCSSVVQASVLNICCLTKPKSLKKTLCVELDTAGLTDYQSGDSFSILALNSEEEVSWLLDRVKVRRPHDQVELGILSDTTRKRPSIPEFINNPSTLFEIFYKSLDIRHIPKKALLKLLSNCCSVMDERLRLLYLSSRQGADLYKREIIETRRGLLDVLHAFPSCTPSVECLIENLPRLLPRAYSVASASHASTLKFAFNVMELPSLGSLTHRKGLVTGKLDKIFETSQERSSTVGIYLRSQHHFRLPSDSSLPLILIGPGTGVAPFIGFLQDREIQMRAQVKLGECLLFFGNRHEESDYLFREELSDHLSLGTLGALHVCFSRDEQRICTTGAKYVTDLLWQQSKVLANLITKHSAIIYVCGDARNMAKDVNEALTGILKVENGYTDDEVLTVMRGLKEDKRYREDVWL
ncbi:methionine synthase reductase-like [Watersipora subatra]|uniref:methionine synthase reductase-like n=1 Tax=Watersipora subatra TaxID=2589382 RepID=UPI00355B03EB